ncbi:NBS-LRR type resistance protein [Cucumis melo var. makuwa]|uniref:NBS-LRR type resistance protein n=1 Tax=Cucumis melo var. makuwa TaxID=1194695 RepID=A0A5D3C148_CUCMM|nr:NBS-LRR type resistance protein [Cucumis melo var. makuwa]
MDCDTGKLIKLSVFGDGLKLLCPRKVAAQFCAWVESCLGDELCNDPTFRTKLRGTLRKQPSGFIERTHQSRDPEGCTYQSSDPEGYTYQSSDPEGCTYPFSDSKGCTYQSSDPEGCTYQSSDPEGCTYQSSDPEGYTYP